MREAGIFNVKAEVYDSEAVKIEGEVDLTGSWSKLKYCFSPELEYDGWIWAVR